MRQETLLGVGSATQLLSFDGCSLLLTLETEVIQVERGLLWS